MNTRLKIDLNQGILEVEGTEAFVKLIYEEYKSGIFATIAIKRTEYSNKRISPISTLALEGDNVRRRPKKKFTSYSIIKNLDLSGNKNRQSLRDFFKLKSPSTNMEKNAVFIYYLQKIALIEGITQDHVYSCYKDVSVKIPQALDQSFIDTAHHKGWIDTSTMTDLKVTTPGENFVEHDLPKKKE
jgi:hypothetical protein